MIIAKTPETFLVQILTQDFCLGLFNWLHLSLFDLLGPQIHTEAPRV